MPYRVRGNTVEVGRAKGWVETREGPTLVQVVGRRIELTPDSPPDPELLAVLVELLLGLCQYQCHN